MNNNMQTINGTELAEDVLESRIPVSTLRSTASPYKHRSNQSLFNSYLSQLTSNSLLEFSTPSISLSKGSFTFSCKPFTAVTPAPATSASNASIDTSDHLDQTDTSFGSSLWPENAFDSASVDGPSTSSPLSTTADLSIFDSFQDEDDAATESDRPDSPVPNSSPFSSPLSSVPSSPATTLITIISPGGVSSTTATRQEVHLKPTKPMRRPARNADARDLPTNKNRPKRPRSPSPPPLIRQTRHPHGAKTKQPRKAPLSVRSQELVGPLIQVLALSGKSSMPTSILMEEVLSATPSLRGERTIEELTTLAISTMDASPVFGRIDGEGLKVCHLRRDGLPR